MCRKLLLTNPLFLGFLFIYSSSEEDKSVGRRERFPMPPGKALVEPNGREAARFVPIPL
jgi:hypothetical protein